MDSNILIIQLKPSYYTTAKSLGYNLETDEISNESILVKHFRTGHIFVSSRWKNYRETRRLDA